MISIRVPDDAEHINILFSGGVDSTILAYLLLKEIERTGDPRALECWIIHRTDGMIRQTMGVLKWLRDHFPTPIIAGHIVNSRMHIRPLVESTLLTYPGVCYTGCNKVIEGLPMTVIIPGDSPPWRGPALNDRHLRPFIEMTKTDVMRLYVEEGILDLLSLTQSCPSKDRCGGCYFCLERATAVAELGINDINNIAQ